MAVELSELSIPEQSILQRFGKAGIDLVFSGGDGLDGGVYVGLDCGDGELVVGPVVGMHIESCDVDVAHVREISVGKDYSEKSRVVLKDGSRIAAYHNYEEFVKSCAKNNIEGHKLTLAELRRYGIDCLA